MSWSGRYVGPIQSSLLRWHPVVLSMMVCLGFLFAPFNFPQRAAAQPSEPHVATFSPQGMVKGVRQVSATFSESMVSLGDPGRIRDPFVIDCAEAGTARWIDSRTWIYDFKTELPGGVRCRFYLQTALTTLAGRAVGGQRTYAFSTGGPAIRTSIPQPEATIAEDQAFVLGLDAAPTEESLLAHVGFGVAGLPARLGVRLVTGETRAAILDTLYGWSQRPHVVILQARQRFPSGASVRLIWGTGVTSESGIATDQEQVLSFKVREPFTAQFHCEREHSQAACLPVRPMTVRFSAAVAWDQVRQIALIGPHEQRWQPEIDGDDTAAFVTSLRFRAPFPEAASFRLEVPAGLTDDAGRSLTNAANFPLQVKTAEFPPLAKFSARFGIIEWMADPALPVTVRQLEPDLHLRRRSVGQEAEAGMPQPREATLDPATGKRWRLPPERVGEILAWLRRVAVAKRDTSMFNDLALDATVKTFQLPKPHGAEPLEVIGIPLDAPGLHIVELTSPRLGSTLLDPPQPMYVPTAALVTNLAVHLKWGREGSLLWVTTLDTGQPMPGAQATVHDCRGAVLWQGITNDQGIALIERLPSADALPRCPYDGTLYHFDSRQITAINRLDGGLFVTAQVGDDFSFVHSSWDRGIEPWRFQLPMASERDAIVAHTILDRALLRAGDTLHMKHLLRARALYGFSRVDPDRTPNRLSIRHIGSEATYEFPLQWDVSGVAETTWAIPKGAKLGQYRIVLARQSTQPGQNSGDFGPEWVAGELRIEEFRVPLMRGIIQPLATPQAGITELPVDLAVQYLSGGGAGHLPVILRAQLRPRSVTFASFEGFAFANGQVKAGIVRHGSSNSDDDEPTLATPRKSAVHQRLELMLDATGTARATITHLPYTSVPLDLLLELEYWDPNGEVQTVSTVVPLWPTTVLVGVKEESWTASRERLMVQVATVDVTGRPRAGIPIRLEVLERKFYSHRKRLVGGYYAYEHVEETRSIGEFCQGSTAANGILLCQGTPPTTGNLIVQAALQDELGRSSHAQQSVWVSGASQWFDVHDSDRMDVLPEKRRYEPGETARLQVRMPFREATALLTLEREGVQEAYVVPLSGTEPVVEVPVKAEYAPNMFISVLAVRGRVSGVQPTAMVDLGRPTFKLGVAEIRVDWRRYELQVKVAADRPVYGVRQKALVHVAVHTVEGQPPPTPSEVAVAAVDESLLELFPNHSWSLLEAMMGQRGHGVQTATAQLEVVGKRHYGLKALPQGGGGGRRPTRELFDTLLLWQGRVPLDANGEGVIEIPLNDALSSFRIVAVATSGLERFGTGSTTIQTTQDLMVLSGIPPLVREGDQFWAAFTLRNTTDRHMDLAVSARVEGLMTSLTPQTASLAAGEAQVIGWEVSAPPGVQGLRYEVEAREQGGVIDRLRVPQQVVPAVPIRTFQATLRQWQPQMTQMVQRPTDALPDRGGVAVLVRSTIADGLDATRQWMRRYPYTCLEQQVSRAVALRDEGLWRDIVGALPAHLDSDGLLKYFPSMPYGSEMLTSYVLSVVHAAGWVIPSELGATMRRGLHKFIEGAIVRRSSLQVVDLPLRKLAALEALSRYETIKPQLVSSISIEPNLWPTSTVLDWWSVLLRAHAMPQRSTRLSDVEHIIRARLNLQGTTLAFSTEPGDSLWWLMTSTDTNALRLILLLLEAGAWHDELPQLLRGALARQRRGTWDLTVANAWGTLAVDKFSQAFEKTLVGGTTTVSLVTAVQHVEWAATPQGAGLRFHWPLTQETLSVEHAGSGQPWVTIQTQAAIPLKTPLTSGYRLSKALTPIDTSTAGRFNRGDVVHVRLMIEAERDMAWVVVHDPIPAGASHLGRGLGREAEIAVQGEERHEWARPDFEERSFEAYRAYYEYLPKGRYAIDYTLRLNHSGRFHMPPTRVEALYAPEMFGELPNAAIEVQR